MFESRYSLLPAAVLCLLLVGCGTAPVQQSEAAPEEVPELTLNLPEKDCTCVQEAERDFTFLERGFEALANGDHIEAVQHFQRYERLEKTDEASWEARIAIAYVSMLPNSPFYDPQAARKSYRRLNRKFEEKGLEVHTEALLMKDALEAFVVLERHIEDLENNNAILKEDLEKREEALKRLRELTLGQRATRQ